MPVPDRISSAEISSLAAGVRSFRSRVPNLPEYYQTDAKSTLSCINNLMSDLWSVVGDDPRESAEFQATLGSFRLYFDRLESGPGFDANDRCSGPVSGAKFVLN
jgi:hypothetical protein